MVRFSLGPDADGEVLLEPVEGSIAHAISLAQPLVAPSADTRVGCAHVRIGLVCMMRRPRHLTTWLRHYFDTLWIARLFVLVDDTPQLAEVFSAPPWSTLVDASYVQGEQRHYHRLGLRQEEFVRDVIPRARAAGCTHLLHIDDDEIVYCHEGVGALYSLLAQHPDSPDLHMHNLEARALPTDLV